MLTVAVLGRVAVRRSGVATAVPSGLTTELLVRLALDAGRPVRAERLVEDLWPDTLGVRLNTLQAKVSQLRRALGDAALLTGDAAGYTLVVDPADVDALDVLRLAETGAALLAAGDAAGAARTCAAGLALFGPEVLPAGGAWALPHRVRLEETRLRLYEDVLAARLQLGAAAAVVGELEMLVERFPLRERLWTLLITALYRAGRQADALAAHRRVKRLLAEELGVDPGPELRAVERRVLAQDRTLDPLPRVRGNVPALVTPLVGRTDDLATLRSRLDDHRLVTLVGPAGVGKTRLATEAARLTRAADGAWLVRLEGVRSSAELPAAVADAVPGFDEVASLRGAELLLVLDNCEHLVDAVGAFTVQALDAAPQVRVLATSQRPLGIDGEAVLVLEPLPEPDAVALFARRAAERAPAFVMDETTAPTVAQLCLALDGLPLAIELAAARTRVLSVAEIVARLDDRFALLADPTARRPERRRTLAAALAWSYDLLFPDDQRGLWALAAFPGGATLPAVEHVLAALGVPATAALDVLERLVDRSLAIPDPATTRFRLLDSVRAFAAERAAEAGASAAVADAVVRWVAGLAEQVATHVRGPEQAAWVARTGAERATIDAALDRADPLTRLRIAVGFSWAWVLLDDGAAAARLRAAAAGAPAGSTVPALLAESWLEAMSGDLGRARTALDAAAALAGPEDALDRHAGFVLFQEARPAEALARLQRGRAAARTAWEEGACVLLGAFAHIALGEIGAGRDACLEAIRLVEPVGDAWGLLHAEAALGRIAAAERRFAAAARHHGHAAESASRLGFAGSAAHHRTHLGRAQLDAGDPAAVATLRTALAGAEEAGDLRQLAMTRVALAEALLSVGDRGDAHDLLRAARRWYADAGGGDGALLAACLWAALRAHDGDPGAGPELVAILTEARTAQDQRVAELADAALRGVPGA